MNSKVKKGAVSNAAHRIVMARAATVSSDLTSLLADLHPGCGRVPWFKILRVIHSETGGSEAGFELANSWSSQGHNYKGREDVLKYWQSIKPGPRPITLLSLAWMARLMVMLYGERK